MIVTLSGCKRSGKDTCFGILKSQWETKGYRVAKFAFADALREVCSVVFGFTNEDFEDDTLKETAPSAVLGPEWTPRRALQFVGTELFRRQIDPDVWVRVGISRLTKLRTEADIVVVTDARFENEIRALEALGSAFVFIVRPSHTPRTCAHESERFTQELEAKFMQNERCSPFDFVVVNNERDALERSVCDLFSDPSNLFVRM